MNLCSKGHDEVCYDGRECPVCVANDEQKDLLREIRDLTDQLRRSEEEVERLNNLD